MASSDDWFLGEHIVEAELEYWPEYVPELWSSLSGFGRAEGMPELTPDEESDEMKKQVEDSDGFDIDFRQFACLFNYRPVDLDRIDYNEKPPTAIRNVLSRLAKKRLEDYNDEEGTSYEFVKIVKSNFFLCVGKMYFITFQVIDPFDNQLKHFYIFKTDYYLCRPHPNQKACVGTARAHTSTLPKLKRTKVISAVKTSNTTRNAHSKTGVNGPTQRNHATSAVFLQNRFHALSDDITTDQP